MKEHDYYNTYLKRLKESYGDLTSNKKEKWGSTALENLLRDVAKSINNSFKITQEPTSIDGSTPDFKIEHTTAIVGYLENKRPDSNLDKVMKSEQIKRYQKLSNNIMLTNYHKWIWLKDGEIKEEVQLFDFDNLKNYRFHLNPEKVKKLHILLLSFLKEKPKRITDISEFAEALAVRTRLLNEFMQISLTKNNGERLQGLYQAFKEQLHPQLKIAEFADAYAQMLTYGLFLARLNSKKDIDLQNAEQSIPSPFALMKELVSFLGELEKKQYRDIRGIVKEILFIINYMDKEAIATNLSFKYRPSRSMFKGKDKVEFEMFATDPFIYFYEDFLAAYNPELRKSRGVYYTPPPIVNFIIRSLDDILKDVFDIPKGFADEKKVTALDFACGTGTFMLEIFQQILENIGEGKEASSICKHLLKNIYGFEYLIAAYAIAHLKLWQYLTDKDYHFQDDDRLQIFLANTLEYIEGMQRNLLLPALSDEAEAGQVIKEKEVLVITGNPPYSAHSQNPTKKIIEIRGKKKKKKKEIFNWIGSLMEDYKRVDGIKLDEKTTSWIQDDYVKFIRFAHNKMQEVDEGVIGIITNHGFIDNITFRGMRKSLMNTFDQIYILDLHGNSIKKEKAPDGIKDDSVFYIKVGVAISFFIKKKGLKKGVFHADLWGKRIEKYRWALDNHFNSVNWRELQPDAPNYFFIPQNNKLKSEHNQAWSISNIFKFSLTGIVTARDHLTIQFTEKEIIETINKFRELSAEEAREHFNLRKDSDNWKVDRAKKDIEKNHKNESMVTPILYRPFDKRVTFYTKQSNGFLARPCTEIMSHMLKPNLALITVRQLSADEQWHHVGISNALIEGCVISNKTKEISYLSPLYLYPPDLSKDKRKENFKKEFRSFINNKYNHEFSPEEIMAYIYAILHSPIYRSRYNEFLCREFPHIPFCDDKKDFEQLAKIGQELIDFHLMTANQPNINLWKGKGDNFKVEKIFFNEKTESLYINKDKYLHPIPKEVWNFQIGSYKVIAKYLKGHKERELDLEKLNHVERIVDIIQKTMKAMETLDSLTPQAFPHWHK